MKKIVILIFVVINFSNIYSQQIFTLSKSINVDNVKKKKLYKDLSTWLSNQSNVSNISDSRDDEISALSFVVYKNPVKFENSSNLTRVYAQQTEGKLNYIIRISIKDNQYTVSISDIKHVPDSKSNNINFGVITMSETAPLNIIDEVGEKWSNDVWADIKSQIQKKFDDTVSSLQNNYAAVN